MSRSSVLALLALVASSALAQSPTLTAHQKLARDVYSELISINTADTVGSVTKAVDAMAKRFRAAGFPEADIKILTPAGHPTKANLIVRYRGRGGPGSAKPILLIAHLDVVAALRSDWPRDPFTLYEENGFFLGRGTSDDKAMASIFVANMLGWKQEGWKPSRDVIVALTADEESGDSNGPEWIVMDHRADIDAAFAINEGGGGTLSGAGMNVKPLFHSIQAAEKVYVDFTLSTANPGGHSSVPRPDNAIYELSDALSRIARFNFPITLNPTTRGFLEQSAKVEAPDIAAAMRAIVANPNDAAALAVLTKDARYNSMLRTTCVATRLAGGHAYNALPQSASANVNCRMVPTSSLEETRAALEKAIGDTGVKITLTQKDDPPHFPTAVAPVDPSLLSAVTELTHKMWGDIPVIPTMSTGATDSHWLREAGIPSYGVSGLFSLPGETNAHGRDEKMRVKSYYDGLEFLDQLVRRLAGGAVP
ncbi:MAG TPA: M20/M25/M40 family metallo-hydrolase [Gemmatimonadaceae bacterium]|jgi:acetylornithine deacetylase/succinyl-diaminopimelate desuccinylase-like protein